MLRLALCAAAVAHSSAFAPTATTKIARAAAIAHSSAFAPTAATKIARLPHGAKLARQSPIMISGLEGPALVSAAHVILAYNLMPLGPTAYGLGMGGKVMSPGQRKWGDRAFGNTMEQFPLVQVALWLHALFVSPVVATQLGMVYLALRLCYPVIWAVWGGEDGVPHTAYSTMPLFGQIKQIYYSTFPQYGIVFYLALSTVLKLAFGFSLNSLVKIPALVAPVGFGYFLYHYAYVPYPILHEKVFSKFFAKPE